MVNRWMPPVGDSEVFQANAHAAPPASAQITAVHKPATASSASSTRWPADAASKLNEDNLANFMGIPDMIPPRSSGAVE